MKISLKGKQTIITGGGSGIGLAMVKSFVDAGSFVHVLDFRADEATTNLLKAGIDAVSVKVHKCDVSSQEDVSKVINSIQGKIEILINNAGIAHIGTAESTEETDFDRLVSVNIKGVYNCLHAVIPKMKIAGGGVVLNTASIAGSLGISDRFAYSMTKGAVLAMTLSVAKDFLSYGIRCNSISPARIHTPFIDGYLEKNYPGREEEMFEKLSKTQPIGRMGKPDEVAALALFLCSDQAGFITGTDYPIDGGFVKLNGG
ncbi:MAG: SDR family oxidoreductase [Bacteroidetes bacterium]|nr:SDR family oxidoreductase [Bacteroidota bacterium]